MRQMVSPRRLADGARFMRFVLAASVWTALSLLLPGYAHAQAPLEKGGGITLPERQVAPNLAASEVSADWGNDGKVGMGRDLDDRPDLTPWNFFTAGWDEEPSKRVRPTGTP